MNLVVAKNAAQPVNNRTITVVAATATINNAKFMT